MLYVVYLWPSLYSRNFSYFYAPNFIHPGYTSRCLQKINSSLRSLFISFVIICQTSDLYIKIRCLFSCIFLITSFIILCLLCRIKFYFNILVTDSVIYCTTKYIYSWTSVPLLHFLNKGVFSNIITCYFSMFIKSPISSSR
jgi:hypothetical protein